ncbi:hypothetical protein GN244_ATG04156 [Phytophthora infestans]|uniref:Uncharacterized protein n=1 Tax=Phytophthora infestans TaxID=4787 RepID=A0A833TC42_PHYIN|nr:hypothetical protein GN244_ATG04156 [Phytophthora infestans]KAF4149411.1 hypothetical protein GN958_ATG01383 [Phytophthora infestans]
MTTAKEAEHSTGESEKYQRNTDTADGDTGKPEENEVDAMNPQHGVKATDASQITVKEAESARSNWLELRARVESVDPRVFSYEKDPKYLQQCEEAKQRRALAVATSVSPGWH